jgi:peptide/nickel transport system permease protein
LFLVLVLGIPLGIIFGALTQEGRNRPLEVAFMSVTSVGGSLPEFLTATLLAFIFAVTLRWLPVGGANQPNAIILPALSVSLRPLLQLARVVRVETLNVLAQDYMRTARSKRLPTYYLYLRHLLPKALTSALTIGGLIFAGLLGGTVIVENVFAWPGLGTRIVTAVFNLDYPVIQGTVLYFGIIVVVINTIVDMLIAFVDPRSMIVER